jgi:hypothetical protein
LSITWRTCITQAVEHGCRGLWSPTGPDTSSWGDPVANGKEKSVSTAREGNVRTGPLRTAGLPVHFAVTLALFSPACLRGQVLGHVYPLDMPGIIYQVTQQETHEFLNPLKGFSGRIGVHSEVSVAPCLPHLGSRWGTMAMSCSLLCHSRLRAF